MKRSAILIAAMFAVAGSVRAADTSDILSMNAAGLEKSGFGVTVNGGGHQAPQPGVQHPAHQQPGNGHNNFPGNHQQPGGHQQPGFPQPGHNGNNYPPYYPPQVQMQNFRFESGSYVFSSDAARSMENAAMALQRAGYMVLEKRNNYTSYTLVFMAPSYLKVEKYAGGSYVFSSDAQKAAEECAAAMAAQGKVILEKNVSGTSFSISYLSTGYNGAVETQTYTSGSYVFSSDAQKAMNETAAALQGINAIILEKRLNGTSYTIVFQAQFRLETQTYTSGSYIFSSDSAKSMVETAAALKSVQNVIILEKRQAGTSYNIVFLAPFRLEPQKYVSGYYTFASDAQRAAGETAAALASQGLRVLEKNVSGTQFTITYFRPGYYY